DDDDDVGDDDTGDDDDVGGGGDDDDATPEPETCESECYLEWNQVARSPGRYDLKRYSLPGSYSRDRCIPDDMTVSQGDTSVECKSIYNLDGGGLNEGDISAKWSGCDKHGTVRVRCDWSGPECSGATCGITGWDYGGFNISSKADARSYYLVLFEQQYGYSHSWASVQAGHWGGSGFQDLSGRVKSKTEPASIECDWDIGTDMKCEATLSTSGISRGCTFGSASVSCAGKEGKNHVSRKWDETITGLAHEVLLDHPKRVESIGGKRVRGYSYAIARNDVRYDDLPGLRNGYGASAEVKNDVYLNVAVQPTGGTGIKTVNDADDADSTTCSAKSGKLSRIRIACGKGADLVQ
ncbi:MAG TPA: hypothetical protein DIU15_15330, partial [Deltaproteobacteria bacterium]|nr:hypothetical protein [Deltaproteobacteria bacterium]